MASSKGGGSVAQERVSTGNSNLDKEINKFYNCISKTHQDPPSIEKVDSCYYQGLGGSDSRPYYWRYNYKRALVQHLHQNLQATIINMEIVQLIVMEQEQALQSYQHRHLPASNIKMILVTLIVFLPLA